MDIYNIPVDSIEGFPTTLEKYKGQALLIVNVASTCGYTPQLLGLEKLYKKYKDRGFKVLAFPCNQFLRQAPGTNQEFANFCSFNYGVTFPVFGKLNVKGINISPLYEHLVNESPENKGQKIKWNFEKFLINKNGAIIKRYASKVTPNELEDDVRMVLPWTEENYLQDSQPAQS